MPQLGPFSASTTCTIPSYYIELALVVNTVVVGATITMLIMVLPMSLATKAQPDFAQQLLKSRVESQVESPHNKAQLNYELITQV